MEAILILVFLYFGLYLFYILRLIAGYVKMKTLPPPTCSPQITFSIIIPFRNEAKNLGILLDSIRLIDYPAEKFEVIFIDDFSTDGSQDLIYKWRMQNGHFHVTMMESIRMSGSPKKDAITRAMPVVVHDWVITTDADCTLPEKWLLAYNDFISKNDVSVIAAPVAFDADWSPLSQFQKVDMISLQAATIGGFGLKKPFMCNGANFAYRKKAFHDLGGFKGNDSKASGDDVFLLHKAVEKMPVKTAFLKSREAIVLTKPVRGIISLLFQRVRWASKSSGYQNDFAQMIALCVFLGNLSLLAIICFAAYGVVQWELALGCFLLKFVTDYILILQGNNFLRKGKMIFPIISSFVYPLFCVVVAFLSFYGRYTWKGRQFR